MVQDSLKIVGHVRAVMTDAAGAITDVREVHNLVVTTGKAVIADRLKTAPSKAAPSYIAIGSGAVAVASTDIALGAEIVRVATGVPTVIGPAATYTAVFAPGVGTGSPAEAGLLNAVTGGDLIARTNFGAMIKDAAATLTVTWTLSIL